MKRTKRMESVKALIITNKESIEIHCQNDLINLSLTDPAVVVIFDKPWADECKERLYNFSNEIHYLH